MTTHLIVTPGKHHVVKTAVGLVDAILRGVDGVVEIGVCSKGLRVDDLIRLELAAND